MLVTLVAIMKIFIINLVLSGDNAIIIAMACRRLPHDSQRKGIILGTFGAVFFRVVLTIFAAWLLRIPFLQLVCGIILLWIGIKLFSVENEQHNVRSSDNLLGAIKIIIVADFIMSMDNILGVAAVAKGDFFLITLGLILSIPLVIFGSKIIMNLIQRWPYIVYLGALVIGYTAGDMLLSDPVILQSIENVGWLHYVVPVACVSLVLCFGSMLNRKKERKSVTLLQKCNKLIKKC